MSKIYEPTVFHITNHKAGSQWVAEILKYAAPERFVTPEIEVRHFFEHPIELGKIYPTNYVTAEQFSSTLFGYKTPKIYYDTRLIKNLYSCTVNRYHFQHKLSPYVVFVVIRDLRDILVSQYFSFLVSHPVTSNRITVYRSQLKDMTLEEGLLYLIDERLPLQAQIQKSWVSDANIKRLLVRYEDLIANEQAVFAEIIDYCGIPISTKRLNDIVRYNSFQYATGRQPGTEDVSKHLRKGVAGDWVNHFTEQVKTKFKERFGELLIQTGYENDLSW